MTDTGKEGSHRIIPIILAGGIGSRLAPLSLPDRPKQFLDLTNEGYTLFQQTLLRLKSFPAGVLGRPLIVTGDTYKELVNKQLREMGIEADVVLEPCRRNTAPAIITAALVLSGSIGHSTDLMLVMPTDHFIESPDMFVSCVLEAAQYSQSYHSGAGQLMTFGVQPTYPATDYGYLEPEGSLSPGQVCPVRKFIEKPNQTQAEALLFQGGTAWNAGVFLFSLPVLLSEAKNHCPDVLETCERALKYARSATGYCMLPYAEYSLCPDISIDYGVMEKSSQVSMILLDTGWTDLGNHQRLQEHLDR